MDPGPGLLGPPQTAALEHRLYLGAIGILLIAAETDTARWLVRGGIPSVVALGVCLCLATIAVLRILSYESPTSLWESAAQSAPESRLVGRRLAVAYDEAGRVERAIEQYESSLRARPRDAPIWVRLGVLLDAVGRSDEAEAAWKQAAELDPDDPHAWVMLVRAALDRGDEAAALRYARELDDRDLTFPYPLRRRLERAVAAP